MKVVNKSRKIIGIGGEPLLPGYTMELSDGLETHPSIDDYLKKGILVNADKDTSVKETSVSEISDLERAKIAEEAVAKYKKEQEEIANAKKAKQAAIKEVKNMNKEELLMKATSMGLDIKDDDTVEDLKDKIIEAINQ